jgi:Holliday junction DNA helicase RuvA
VIARLEGTLIERGPTRAVIDVGGVGYEVLISLSTFAALPDEGKVVAVHVHTHAREGALQLFGFASALERTAFELLLRASRVGPKLARTLLSGLEPAELLEAIRNGDAGPLCAVPGVGRKMADRILVELRDRGDELAAAITISGASVPGAAREQIGARDQALSALLNLGYAKGQAEPVLASVENEIEGEASIEALVRGSLKRLAR